MAVVNRTPDSFFDQGRTFALDRAIEAALQAVEDGADWIDIGGAPFAPGPAIPIETEIERVVPVIGALRAASDVVISVDTFHAEVAQRSVEAGANIVNDTTGLRDRRLADVIRDTDATVVITHSLASPRTQFSRPRYDDVVLEVRDFLCAQVDLALSLGIPEDRIIIDPGHDLNKNTAHSLELTRHLQAITSIGLPTLVAVSNKDFIGETLDAERGDRLEGSLAAAVACILQGARIVRMHDVTSTVAAVRMTEAIMGFREPMYARHNMGEFNE